MDEFIRYVLPLYDVVAFNLFGTFLLRPVFSPADLFTVIGGQAFSDARTKAEHAVHADARTLYTLGDIYRHMPAEMQDMQQVELAEEGRRTVVNPPILEAYRKARALGKKIVFMADTYLPEAEVRKLLAAKGITEYDGLYVSCDRGCSKYDGALFRKMANDQHVAPQTVVYVGSSKRDLSGGTRVGVYTRYVPEITDTLFDENTHLAAFFRENHGADNPTMRRFFGALALAYHLNKCAHGDDPWCRTGCTLTAPMYYSYMRWVLEQAKTLNKKKLLLCLRDCHIIGKMLDRVAPDVDYQYLATPRAAVKPVLEDGLNSPKGKACAKYINANITSPADSLIVEGTSSRGSVECAINCILGRRIPAVYFSRSLDPETCEKASYIKNSRYEHRYTFIETTGSAPLLPYRGFSEDGTPVHKEPITYDKYRNYGVQRREQAAVETAALLFANDTYLTGEECERFIECCFAHTDPKDTTFFLNQLTCWDTDHNAWCAIWG